MSLKINDTKSVPFVSNRGFLHESLPHTIIPSKIEPKRYFPQNKSTLILGIVLVLVFRCFLDKKDRLDKSTKNGRLKD